MEVVKQFEQTQKKTQVAAVRSGDTVRVYQRITEGSKERAQAFEGVVIRTRQMNSLHASITVRRISSGVGVEKTFKLHAPNIEKVEVLRRSKVRRNYLTYLRQRQGKSARLKEVGLDRSAVEVDESQTEEEQQATAENTQDNK